MTVVIAPPDWISTPPSGLKLPTVTDEPDVTIPPYGRQSSPVVKTYLPIKRSTESAVSPVTPPLKSMSPSTWMSPSNSTAASITGMAASSSLMLRIAPPPSIAIFFPRTVTAPVQPLNTMTDGLSPDMSLVTDIAPQPEKRMLGCEESDGVLSCQLPAVENLQSPAAPVQMHQSEALTSRMSLPQLLPQKLPATVLAELPMVT